MSSIIETLFGSRKTPAERLRQHQRALQKAQRELDRERTKLEGQEKKLIADIRKNAKDGQMSACKIQARDLVRTRRHIQKFYQMKTQLQAVSLRIQALRSNQQMGEAIKGATRAMGMMNRSMNLPQVQRIMREFERESEVMDMKEEMMGDAVDQAMDDEADGIGEEEEGDAILKEVLDSIGVDLGQSLVEAPTAALNAPIAQPQRVAIGEGIGSGSGSGSASKPAASSSSATAAAGGNSNTKDDSPPGSGSGGSSGAGGLPSGLLGPGGAPPSSSGGGGGGGAGMSDEDALQARLDMLRRD